MLNKINIKGFCAQFATFIVVFVFFVFLVFYHMLFKFNHLCLAVVLCSFFVCCI